MCHLTAYLGSYPYHAHQRKFQCKDPTFHVFNIWCHDQDLRDLVNSSLEDSSASRSSLGRKLNAIKMKVSRWQPNKYWLSTTAHIMDCKEELGKKGGSFEIYHSKILVPKV